MTLGQRSFPQFNPIAEHGLLVEFGEAIDHAIHDRVLQLDSALTANPFEGFAEAVPAYASVLVRFDPLVTDHPTVVAHIKGLLTKVGSVSHVPTEREILVCYDEDLGPDLAAVAKTVGLSTEAVINAHMAGRYDVFMYGFAPGYAYLAGVPEEIRMPRKPAAVRGISAGSVLIAGPQCLVSTITMPTGWWIIGRTRTRILTGEPERPFLFDVGDRVKFTRITRDAFEAGAPL